MGLCSSNYSTHKGRVYLFAHTHKIETKRTINLKPQNNIEKTKRREKKKTNKKKYK